MEESERENDIEPGKEEIHEDYIVRQSGYLRVPRSLTRRYGSPINWPEPIDVRSFGPKDESNDDEIVLRYVWSKKELKVEESNER